MQQQGRPYSVEPPNAEWKIQFEKERDTLERLLEGVPHIIEHIGSTSVEGLWAKPQIDILVIVDALDDVRKRKVIFEDAGYISLGDYTGKGEEYFARDAQDGRRMVSIHVMTKDTPDVLSQIILRDYLRCHPLEVEEYSEVKRRAYDNGKTGRAEYPKKKKDFLFGLIDRSQSWAKESNWKCSLDF
jgi:GrpB-like predicted nucleotidyltransferase (UPF0157 family)